MTTRMRLTEMLEERDRTIYWLAKQVDIDFTALYRMRDGLAKGVKFDLLGRMCEALNCEISDLLVLVDDKRPDSKRKAKAKAER